MNTLLLRPLAQRLIKVVTRDGEMVEELIVESQQRFDEVS